MGLFSEIFLNEKNIPRIIGDFPLIYIATITPLITQYFLTTIEIDPLRILFICFVSFVVLALITLIYVKWILGRMDKRRLFRS